MEEVRPVVVPDARQPGGPGHGDDGDEPRTHNRVTAAAVGTAVQVGVVHGGLHVHPRDQPGPPTGRAALPDEAAERLARAAGSQWRREEGRRRVWEPSPLPVRWRLAPGGSTDRAAGGSTDRAPDAHDAGPGTTGDAVVATGRLDDVVRVYRRLRFGRLVVLGRPGSGKTVLTLRLVLDLLDTRADRDPVPVVFSLGSWDPTGIEFEDWLIDRLVRDYAGLDATGPDGRSLAAALVEAGRVLPVLDGFDEIADGLHHAALDELNATATPLVLTSRTGQYEAAATATRPLIGAAGIELLDLTPDDVAEHLSQTARDPGRWTPVLDELRARPRTDAGDTLAAVLSTPLMVSLARGAYDASPDRDPAELLDTGRFGSPAGVEAHLLADYTLAAYRRPPHDGLRRRWEPEDAERWLGYLAWHLTELGTPDLDWWKLGAALGHRTRALAVALVSGLVIGLVEAIVVAALVGTGGLTSALGAGLVVGSLAGGAFGVVNRLAGRHLPAAFEPSRVRVRIPPVAGAAHAGIVPRLRWGLVIGLVFGLVFTVVRKFPLGAAGFEGGFANWVLLVLFDAVVFGPLFALGAGITMGLTAWLETPLDTRSAVSPLDLLRRNRANTAFRVLVVVPVLGLVIGVGSGLAFDLARVLLAGTGFHVRWDAASRISIGLVAGLGCGIGYAFSATAWGRWATLARVWLPLAGRLPWAVPAFLDDAHHRGVLRQSGAAYQFRHARLQEQLDRTYRDARRNRRRSGARRRRPGRRSP
ncbi:NACHT domain-containing protein [Saccharothrix sp. 6-C]|uniref:NACHT domain-containing protein n=1 Tax=Saccharothrix sp. 6-C TaxID=2781735 RepID=UPI001917697C|nr:NACHT domain-containing protein [Saccharothrix sp. 6-C]QQQ73400.1 NACHT domain-containing protein [Saccharothrix sp. 6-C]